MLQNHQKRADHQDNPQFIRVSRLHSIKTRLLAFALLATVIPSVTLGSLAYHQISRFLNQKISQNLRSVTAQVSRELDLSNKERIYDLRIFSSSYIIRENLAAITENKSGKAGRLAAVRMMNAYLQSIRKRFGEYLELMITRLDGSVLSTSNGQAEPSGLPVDWKYPVGKRHAMVSKVLRDPVLGERVVVLSEPIRDTDNSVMGIMCAKLPVQSLGATLSNYATADTDGIYLVDGAGKRITGSDLPSGPEDLYVDQAAIARLIADPEASTTYRGHQNRMVIGTMAMIPSLNLRVVVETDRDKAFRRVAELQRLTLILTLCIILFIGACAYVLALTIVQPLKQLRVGADQVAGGNLNVDLPVRNRSEVGYLTQVFNHMVQKLRHGVEELDRVNAILREKNEDLHQISITDPLTGLYNRKQLMEALGSELARSGRHNYVFALLLIDIDHFKSINDTYGHQKGDDVLCRLAAIFRENIRKCDYAARYGGEEFVILLTETDLTGAREVAERIRQAAGRDTVASEKGTIAYTVSIGIGVFPRDGDNADAMIEHADKALYEAKKSGRNQVRDGWPVKVVPMERQSMQ